MDLENANEHRPVELGARLRQVELQPFQRFFFHEGKPGVERKLVLFKTFKLLQVISQRVIEICRGKALDPLVHGGEEFLRFLFFFQDIDERQPILAVRFKIFDTVCLRHGTRFTA